MPQAKSLSIPPIVPNKHAPGYRLRRAQNWVLLGLTYASYYLCRNNLSIIAPELKADLKLDNEKFGSIQTARDWAYAVGQFVNGLFADRLGGKLTMTLGAIGTVTLNVMFGYACMNLHNMTWILIALVVIRMFDGYVQAFGAPGMVKINAAWFRREERGAFAGVFGGMIQLGAIGVGLLGKFFTTGSLGILTVYAYVVSINAPKLHWHYMFFVPPAIVVIITILMNLLTKNHPEEAGYRVLHDDESTTDDPHARIDLSTVFVRIASNPVVWIVASAYFCTGFVRRAIESYWVIWLKSAWGLGKESGVFSVLIWAVPLTAFIGSMGSGLLSDLVFKGRRAPVAAGIYLCEVCLIILGVSLAQAGGLGGVWAAAAVLVGLNMTCNSTHSILGSAAPMDLGGRKMAGFATGVIDSFQYIGAGLAGKFLGKLLDAHAGAAVPATASAAAGSAIMPASSAAAPFNTAVWFGSMLPFAGTGAVLMLVVWYTNRGKDRRGA